MGEPGLRKESVTEIPEDSGGYLCRRVYKAARKSPYDEEVAQIMDEQKKPYHYRKRKSGRTSQGKIYADH